VSLKSYSFTVYDLPRPLGRPRFARTPAGIRTYTPRKDQEARFNIRSVWLEKFPEVMITRPLRLLVTAWLPMPKWIPKKYREWALPGKRPDLDNYLKQVEDALNGYAYKDDALVVTIEARKRYVNATSPGSPRWEITLEEIID
jgi:Holliday junction resolvase RusA-like endonuclease